MSGPVVVLLRFCGVCGHATDTQVSVDEERDHPLAPGVHRTWCLTCGDRTLLLLQYPTAYFARAQQSATYAAA